MAYLSTLFRYPNATVQYDSRTDGYETSRSKLTHIKLIWLLENTSSYRNLKLVLRKLESLTDDEAKECFKIASGWLPMPLMTVVVRHDAYVMISADKDEEGDTYTLQIEKSGYAYLFQEVCVKDDPELFEIAYQIRIAPLVDYLRSINIDLDNLLASGEAVEEK